MRLLFLLFIAVIALSHLALEVRADHLDGYHCNCVGCQSPQLIHGSVDWCRCCENSMLTLCRSDTTEDYRCQRSVFDPVGCVRDGYMTLYCLPEDDVFTNSTSGIGHQVDDPDLSQGDDAHSCDKSGDSNTVVVLAIFLALSLVAALVMGVVALVLYRRNH